MNSRESALYNRISTKCHAYVRYYHPDIYDKLVAAVEVDKNFARSRRNTREDIENALFEPKPTLFVDPLNPWNDPDFPVSSEEEID